MTFTVFFLKGLKKMAKKKKDFSNLIWGLDIETTTIQVDDENHCSFMYSFCLGSLDLDTGEYKNHKLGRTYTDLDSCLEDLNKLAYDFGKDFIVYIHNFSYEYSFFSNNLEFFKKYNNMDRKNYLFIEQNKPLFFKCDKLEFRCSYLLLDKSIKAIGESIGLPKLDFDYDKLRTPNTPLEEKEIEYNFRDVEIMLKGVYQLFKNNQYMRSANEIAYTKTGVMRHNCEQNPEVNVKRKYTNKYGQEKSSNSMRLNKYLCGLEKAETLEQLEFWQELFQGGLVVSNPEIIGDILTSVASFDFSSDYPFQMLARYFPSKFKVWEGDRKHKLESCLYNVTERAYIHSKPLRTMFNAVVIVSDIKAKFTFHPIGTSKIEELDEPLKNTKNCKIINGKIIEVNPPIKMKVTCIDMVTLKLFYDFNLVDVEYLEVATSYNRSNEFNLNSVEFNGKAKSEFKVYDKLIEEAGEFRKYSKEEIDNDHYRSLVNTESDYFSQLETSHLLYQSVKSDLNALYGNHAQHLLHELISYDDESREWVKELESFEDYQKTHQKTSYIYGLYVPQYARASILYIAYKFLTNGLPVYYIDTDSIKTTDCELAQKLVDEYNEIQLTLLGKFKYLKFGILEKEYTANKFATLGTKSYIKMETTKDGKQLVKATISGLPHATKIFNELLDYFGGNFDEMIENVYHYGTCFSSDITKKMTSLYNFIETNIDIDGYTDRVVSGVVLSPCEVTMRDFTSKTWSVYARLICSMYRKDYDTFTMKTLIRRNYLGEIEVI